VRGVGCGRPDFRSWGGGRHVVTATSVCLSVCLSVGDEPEWGGGVGCGRPDFRSWGGVVMSSQRRRVTTCDSALTDDDGATNSDPPLRRVGITIRDSALNDDGRATGAAEYAVTVPPSANLDTVDLQVRLVLYNLEWW
jgi:hypothetical protein